MSKRIIVVGHGMVGQRFLEALTEDKSQDLSITMLAEVERAERQRRADREHLVAKALVGAQTRHRRAFPGARR